MSLLAAESAGRRDAVSAPANGLQGLANGFAALACVLTFALSPNMLYLFGIPYGIEGGSLVSKVHPGTWAALAALGLHGLRAGNPVNYLAVLGWRFPGSTIFAALLMPIIAYNGLVQAVPVSMYIDTFLAPVVMLWLLPDLRETGKGRLRLFLHLFMAANALLGLYELKSGFRLTPFLVGTQEQVDWDWRSTAFLGHPLANGVVSAIYMVTIAFERRVPVWLRCGIIALQLVAMSAFGARAATGMVVVALGLLVARHLMRIAAGARVSLAAAAAVLTVVPLAAGAAVLVVQAGLFDQFIDRVSNDSGSAQVRVLMFDLFKGMSWDAFLFGSNAQQISTQQYMNGFEYGIESFWIASIVMQGVVMSLVLWSCLFLFLADLVRSTSLRALWPVSLAIAVASTSLSLGSKTSMLTFLVSFVVLFLQDSETIRKT